VSDDDDAAEIELVFTRDGPDVIDGASDIEVGAGPPAARFSEPPVLDVPRRNPVCFEGVGHRAEVTSRRVGSLEATPMDEDDERMWSDACGNAPAPIRRADMIVRRPSPPARHVLRHRSAEIGARESVNHSPTVASRLGPR
jgi:hypothetical protein